MNILFKIRKSKKAKKQKSAHCHFKIIWSKFSSRLRIYGSTLSNLQSRIIQVYLNSLQSDKTTFATLFGTCVGFAELGTDACRTFIFPLVKVLGERIAQILDSVSTTNQEKMPVDKCKQELVVN